MKTTLTATSLILLFLFSLTSPMATVLSEERSSEHANGRSTACSGYVCINEVIPNPNGLDAGTYPDGEWFELHNSGTVDVDLTGWKVTTSASKTLNFDSNTIVGYQAGNASTWTISPGEYVVIARNGDNNFYMTNTGMSMTLVDSNNNNLHQATWGSVLSGKELRARPRQRHRQLDSNKQPDARPSQLGDRQQQPHSGRPHHHRSHGQFVAFLRQRLMA